MCWVKDGQVTGHRSVKYDLRKNLRKEGDVKNSRTDSTEKYDWKAEEGDGRSELYKVMK